MYHMHIELRWFFVTMLHAQTMCYRYSAHAQLENFENVFGMVINDLLYSALKVFERVNTTKNFKVLLHNSKNILHFIFTRFSLSYP